MIKQLNIEEELWDHQKRYYEQMKKRLPGPFHSLVCIPTGGGKTRLATVFLINQVLCEGKKVLWIAHSKYLLNQAYGTFEAYLGSEWMEQYAILIHSGVQNRVSDIKGKHQIIFVTIQSLRRAERSWKEKIGEIGGNTFVVVDEAHHASASSYMALFQDYIDNKNLIGLTATPTRMKRTEIRDLCTIFKDDLGVKVHMTELFHKKKLVPPVFEIVNYSNTQIQQQEFERIDDLDEYLVENSEDYNQKILEKYQSAEEKYGKTVVFAIDKNHADSLYEKFCSVYGSKKVFLIYSGLKKTGMLPHFPSCETRETQFDAFKRSEKGILINIDILNEGVDIPDIQTVFLTRPSKSEVVVTQSIGRALRYTPNKKCAYVVNFAVSNLGKRLLLVMPQMVYQQELADWEGDQAADEFEQNEQRVTELEKMVKAVKKKSDVCSFSDVVLAGNYVIVSENDTEDFTVPVSFKEYRKIEHFRTGYQPGKKYPFPGRLFFSELDSGLLQSVFQREGIEYDISFKPYNAELLDGISALMDEMTGLVEQYYKAEEAYDTYRRGFEARYEKLLNDKDSGFILWYLNQVGIQNKKDFADFMLLEMALITRQLRKKR